jgi:hypothetical protein
MKKFITIFSLLLLFVANLNAQTISSNSWKNGLKEVAAVPDSMTYDEFLKLQREVTWQRIFAAAFIPGYIHFYAKHSEAAWYIFAGRLVGASLMVYGLLDEVKYAGTLDFTSMITDKDQIEARSQRNLTLFIAGTVINALGFAIDWARGDWIISKERNEVLYKYGLKLRAKVSPKVSFLQDSPVYGLNLKINF